MQRRCCCLDQRNRLPSDTVEAAVMIELSPVAGEPEQHEKKVDEVKIERQSAKDGRFSSLGSHVPPFP